MKRAAVIILATVMTLIFIGTSKTVYAKPKPKPAAAAVPAAAPDKKADQKSEDLEIKKEIYYYQSEALERRDPFMSIIAIREKEEKTEVSAPPLQKYDLSQMKLFAVVLSQKQQYAMVLLPDGKYYTVMMGDKIGIHSGYVSSMSLSTVTVIESLRDYKGQIMKKEVLLRLRAEEGE